MRVVFMGTPDFAVPALEAIIAAGHEVVLVVTQPDKPKGRSGQLQISDVKACAVKHNIPVFQPEKIREKENVEYLKKTEADIYVVAAFGQIVSQDILDIPKYGCVNIHASLLPKYRGASPIQQSILDGESVTGVTIQQMNIGVDTGDILSQRKYVIAKEETGGSLFEKLSKMGAELITDTLDRLKKGEIVPVAQDESKATKCGKLKKDMGKIDWTEDATKIERYVRGLNPWPSAYTFYKGKQLKIWKAEVTERKADSVCSEVTGLDKNSITVACGKDALKIYEVQLEGKKRMPVSAFLLGYNISAGDRFGD